MKKLLKSGLAQRVAEAAQNYFVPNSNLKCEFIEGNYRDENLSPFLLPVRNHAHSGNLAEAAAVIDSYRDKKIFSAIGRPLYSDAARILENGFGDDKHDIKANEELLKTYADWYASHPDCPYAATYYASALQITGHSHRGTDWGHKVKAHQWEAMEAYNQQAQKVFNDTRHKFHNHWYWSKNYLSLALTTSVTKSEIWRRFENCIAANPYDYRIYETMANMMLPRWHGSFADVEQVALRSVKATKEHSGDMMYAATFASILDYHDLSELEFNWVRLRKGFEDWLTLFPSDYVKTYFASAAYTMKDYGLALNLLESLDAFYIENWDADDDITLANATCRKFRASQSP